MKAMLLHMVSSYQENWTPLDLAELPQPVPKPQEVLLKVSACGVCHTELDEIEGRTLPPHFPIVPGHQVVGRIIQVGSSVKTIRKDDRVGVGWIFSACGRCEHCLSGNENLCSDFMATGRDAHGGYAYMMVVPAASCYPIPDFFTDEEAAPLLCAGAIGFRSLNLTNLKDGETLGLLGFGASAHLVIKMVPFRFPRSQVFVFTRSQAERRFAESLGAAWVGSFEDKPPALVNAMIDTTPAWKPILTGLEFLKPGGRLVVNAIRKERQDQDWLIKLDYPQHLWMEKEIKSVANVTRSDISQFLDLAAKASIKPQVQIFPFEEANQALAELKQGNNQGAKVLKMD